MSAVQDRNSEQVNLLRGEFQGRYEPQFAAMGISGRNLQLSALRGHWPFSAVDGSGNAVDQSGRGNDLTINGTPTFDFSGLVPYADFNGTTDYFTHIDSADFDIIGTEAYVGTNGLSLGGWFYTGSVSTFQVIMGKYFGAVANRSYALIVNSAQVQFRIYDPVNTLFSVSINNAVTLNNWHYIQGIYTPSTSIVIRVNDQLNTNAVGIPASLFNSSASFAIGARGDGANYLTGRASNCYLAASALSQANAVNLYNQSKSAYGVE